MLFHSVYYTLETRADSRAHHVRKLPVRACIVKLQRDMVSDADHEVYR